MKRRLIEQYQEIPASCVSDALGGMYTMDAQLRPLNANKLIGTAFTVKTCPGDNCFVHKAIEEAEAGDIVVIDAGGAMNTAMVGETVLTRAVARELGGVVVFGAVRDTDFIANCPIPVYAMGITPRGPTSNGPGALNVPVCCANQPVLPGDLLIGDFDGLVVVPKDQIEATLPLAENKKRSDERKACAAKDIR